MTLNKFSRCLSALAFLVFYSRAHAQAAGSSELSARVDSIATAVLATTGVPSATVAVVAHGKLAYAQAYGSARLDPTVPATPDMQYGIGSISKQFTAACILLLQQEGKLKLDDPVSKYVPGLTRGNEVTIRQILSHTSGYQDFWPQDYVPPAMAKPITPQAILDHWAKQPLDFEPGTRWQYSNTNFEIAALIVEKASGKPFFQFVRTRILDPLRHHERARLRCEGADRDSTDRLHALRARPAASGDLDGAGMDVRRGELAMTARDLAKWDIAMIDQSLLKPESYHAMETAVLLKNGVSSDYGLGVDVYMQGGHRMIEHSGEVAGFTAENIVYPDDSAAVIVLTNQDAAPASGLIANSIGGTLFTTEDADTRSRTARAQAIFEALQRGTIDRSLLTDDASAYFSAQALTDFQSTLAPLGTPTSFVQTAQHERGGMLERIYRVSFKGRTLRVWTYEMPDGKIEQYQLSPTG